MGTEYVINKKKKYIKCENIIGFFFLIKINYKNF